MTDLDESLSPSDDEPRSVSNASSTKRKNAKAACENCKRRKLKCSGDSPCGTCAKAGTLCTIDEDTDQRRKNVLKRKLSSMEDKGALLDDLIGCLQQADEICAIQIIGLIRNRATLEEIRRFLDNLTGIIEIRSIPEVLNAIVKAQDLDELPEATSQFRTRPGHQHGSKMTMFQVPAKPWTTVTDDDHFVSHLISLWFTWSHPYLNWIDQDLFIRDMQSGNTNARFCSPFLVNVILADACAYADSPEALGGFEGKWSRGLDFYEEAKRRLEEQEGRISIVNVQGLCVLYVVTCMIGRDRTGWLYYGQLAYATQELSRRHQEPPDGADREVIDESSAIDNAIWGIFNFSSVTALAYQKSALITTPRRKHRTPERDVHEDVWFQYPLSSEAVISHRECLFTALCDMGEIIYRLGLNLFKDKGRKLDIEFARATEEFYLQLRAWYENIPDCLASDNATPHVLSLHLNYYTTIQTIFGYLKGLPRSADASDGDGVELEDIRQQARERCIDSARVCAALVDQQREAWGLVYMVPVNIHWFTVSMYTLLEALTDDVNQKAFNSLSIGAAAASHQWPLGRGMLRLVQLTSKQMEVSLPPETEALFSDFEARVWRHQDRGALKSQYPHFAHSMKHGEDQEIELDAFLRRFDGLEITPELELESESESKSKSEWEESTDRGVEESSE